MEAVYIILGWLFGVLTPSITNRISNHYEKDKLQRIIVEDLKDLKKRLVFLPYKINSDYGTVDKELFIWIKEQTQNFKELESDFESKKLLKDDFAKINSKSDKESIKYIEQLNCLGKKDNPAFHFKKMTTSVIDSNLINIGMLDSKFLAKLLEVKFQINVFNEEINNVNEYLKMTFNSNITNTNHQIITKEIDSKNLLISEKAIYIVEKINNIINFKN